MRALLPPLIVATLFAQTPSFAFDQSHKSFSKELQKYVENGLVHYRLWKANPDGLSQYIASLSALSPDDYKAFSEDEKKTLWLNAYNAITIKEVLNHYPIKGTISWFPQNSIRQVDGFWENYHYKIAGQNVTLDSIMHKFIRSQFHDPRMHFAVVPASKGCLPLRQQAYEAGSVEVDLEKEAKTFVSSPKCLKIEPDKQEVAVSQIFKWFPLDFAKAAGFDKMPFPPPSDEEIILAYIQRVSPQVVARKLNAKEARLTYIPYDWSLNDADANKQ